MSKKDKILALYKKNPSLNRARIAEACGATRKYVNRTIAGYNKGEISSIDTLSKDRILEVLGYAQLTSDIEAATHFNLAVDTLRRYKQVAKDRYGIEDVEKTAYLNQIIKNYSVSEIEAIAKGGRVLPGMDKIPEISFKGDTVTMGAFSDCHLGSKFTNPEYMYLMYKEFENHGVDFAVLPGDVTEGMNNRPGHIYELSHLGYDQQKEHAIKVLSDCPVPIKACDGNHDRWYLKSNGACIVKDISAEVEQVEYLGHDSADISLNGVVTARLWHGLDGNSYALSYRLQKVIEAITGGEKPAVMFCGHTHKSLYIFERHIHCFSVGAIQRQTSWMKGKRIAAHTGFWIIELTLSEKGIARCRGEWFPFYA